MLKMGVIGYGSRVGHVIDGLIREVPECKITAVCDIRGKAAIEGRLGAEDMVLYDTPEQMLEEANLDGVLIGTRCSLHTEMAIKVFQKGIPLFLEKPVSTNMKDLLRLKEASEASSSEVVVSFPLRLTSMVQMVKEIVDSGKIGSVEHVQAFNNVPYGNVYYQNWYRDEDETQGLFLQKATHDFDYINYVLQIKPTEVCAMTSKQIFKGNKPAGLKCVDCEENRTCSESTAFRSDDVKEAWPYCCFAEDTGNEDSGSAIVRYETGMHVSYTQNFFVKREAGTRGARFLGHKGTVEFDFMTGIIKVFMHHTPRVETYEFKSGDDGHFGGDSKLYHNFADVMRGKAKSLSSIEDGLMSALMCIKARHSDATRTFKSLEWRE